MQYSTRLCSTEESVEDDDILDSVIYKIGKKISPTCQTINISKKGSMDSISQWTADLQLVFLQPN